MRKYLVPFNLEVLHQFYWFPSIWLLQTKHHWPRKTCSFSSKISLNSYLNFSKNHQRRHHERSCFCQQTITFILNTGIPVIIRLKQQQIVCWLRSPYGSPLGSLIPGILQARTHWVGHFSEKMKVKGKGSHSVNQLYTAWTAAQQAPPVHGTHVQDTRVRLPSIITQWL